ncbi:hypothetical protein HHK36_009318 [Tetracentron sinense]|uniref:Uncharacterized protein n=1 Tax=Tetracentron sinense TaxID=13715 RepID=A0A835DHD3_TETSI|nr:hypothetical protein HHK36_009318 [Tetracentron sinense]
MTRFPLEALGDEAFGPSGVLALGPKVRSSDWPGSDNGIRLRSIYAKKKQRTLEKKAGAKDTEAKLLMRAAAPLVEVLRLVDGDKKPAMGYIYEAILRAKEKIKIFFANKENDYTPIIDIVDKRWIAQLGQLLHAATFFLNPALYFERKMIPGQDVGEFEVAFIECVERMLNGGTYLGLKLQNFKRLHFAFSGLHALLPVVSVIGALLSMFIQKREIGLNKRALDASGGSQRPRRNTSRSQSKSSTSKGKSIAIVRDDDETQPPEEPLETLWEDFVGDGLAGPLLLDTDVDFTPMED